jgi:hypothetical protein
MQDERISTSSRALPSGRAVGIWSQAGSNRVLSVSAWLLIIEQGVLLAFISLHGVAVPGQASTTGLGAWAIWFLSLATLTFASVVLINATARTKRGESPKATKPSFPLSWETANKRRILLIDKDLDGSIAPSEKVELEELEQATGRFLDAAAPLPTAVLDDLGQAIREAEGRARRDGERSDGE